VHEVTVKKLWKGQFVSVRHNQLLKGSYSGGLIVRHDRKTMIISAELCKEKYLEKDKIGTVVQSKYSEPYIIIDFRWNPTDDEHKQGVLL